VIITGHQWAEKYIPTSLLEARAVSAGTISDPFFKLAPNNADAIVENIYEYFF
jgi:hypothetical protein